MNKNFQEHKNDDFKERPHVTRNILDHGFWNPTISVMREANNCAHFLNFFILHALFIVMTTNDSRNIKRKSVIFLQGEDCNVFRHGNSFEKKKRVYLRRSLTFVNALFSRKKLGSHLFTVWVKKLMQVVCTTRILELRTVKLSLLPSVDCWRGYQQKN